MTRSLSVGALSLCWLLSTSSAMAQDAVPEPPTAEVPPPPPADDSASGQSIPEPPAAYASSNTAAVVTNATASASSSDALPSLPPVVRDPNARRLFNISLGLGIGGAVGCKDSPDSPCAVDLAATFALAADYRFHPKFGAGLEIGIWGFSVRDDWRGSLAGDPDNAEINFGYLAVFGRWYWFDRGILDPYLQAGLGIGAFNATVSNATDSWSYSVPGVVPQFGAGIDFHVHPAVKLGPQLFTALLLGTKICEKASGRDEVCRNPGDPDASGDKDEKEGKALAWRFMLVGTVMLGAR